MYAQLYVAEKLLTAKDELIKRHVERIQGLTAREDNHIKQVNELQAQLTAAVARADAAEARAEEREHMLTREKEISNIYQCAAASPRPAAVAPPPALGRRDGRLRAAVSAARPSRSRPSRWTAKCRRGTTTTSRSTPCRGVAPAKRAPARRRGA